MISMEINTYLRKLTYSLVVLCIPFLFYKIFKHPDKGYGIVMILILLGSFFGGAVLKMFTLFGLGTQILPEVVMSCNKFNVFWGICLALYHYSLLRAFKGKFRIYPYKTFIFSAVFLCIVMTFASNAKTLKRWSGDSYLINIIALTVLLFIAWRARRFGNAMHIVPFSVHKSATELYKFALIMSFFPLNDMLLTIGLSKASCSNSQNIVCVLLDLYSLIIYQSWVWYTIYFNWKTLMNVRGERFVSTSQRSYSLMDADF